MQLFLIKKKKVWGGEIFGDWADKKILDVYFTIIDNYKISASVCINIFML